MNTTTPAGIDDLLPAPVFTTERIDRHGMNLRDEPHRKYSAETPAFAAALAARAHMTLDDYATADVEHEPGTNVWAYIPHYGAVVRIRVIDAPTEHEPDQPTETPEHDVQVRTWTNADVVARDEPLHPATHPHRYNEALEYVGPLEAIRGTVTFNRVHEPDMAEVLTLDSGAVLVDVADLRRPAGNIVVEMTPDDVARIFQALCTERDRLVALAGRGSREAVELAVELSDRFAALHPDR
jgi:hypothetical protein